MEPSWHADVPAVPSGCLPGSDFFILIAVALFQVLPIHYVKSLLFDVAKMLQHKLIELILHFPDVGLVQFVDGALLRGVFFQRFSQVRLAPWNQTPNSGKKYWTRWQRSLNEIKGFFNLPFFSLSFSCCCCLAFDIMIMYYYSDEYSIKNNNNNNNTLPYKSNAKLIHICQCFCTAYFCLILWPKVPSTSVELISNFKV